ncbi:hypothetical protein C1I88_02925 [Akkermansia muciniphila]|nr:hypothetical protein C1I88_02925 [Akkermansia muciniphila]
MGQGNRRTIMEGTCLASFRKGWQSFSLKRAKNDVSALFLLLGLWGERDNVGRPFHRGVSVFSGSTGNHGRGIRRLVI